MGCVLDNRRPKPEIHQTVIVHQGEDQRPDAVSFIPKVMDHIGRKEKPGDKAEEDAEPTPQDVVKKVLCVGGRLWVSGGHLLVLEL